MNEVFASVFDRLIDPDYPLGQALDEVRLAGDFSDDLLDAMCREVEAENWSAVARLVHTVFLCPSKKFTPLLCKLLDIHPYEGYMEAIADAFMDAPDERAVPAIRRVIPYHLSSDADSHFNRKLIQALKKIGTQEAIAVIKEARNDEREPVREEAQEALIDLEIV